jgi:uncharacterized protein
MLNRLRNLLSEQPSAPTDHFQPHPSWAKANQEKREARLSLEKRDDNGNTPLIRTIMARDLHAIHSLLEAGADINGRGYLGYTPIAVAAYYGFFDIAQYLVNRGAMIDLYTNGKPSFRPLTVAMRFSRNIQIVRLLILAGADIHTPDGSGYTPLMTAAGMKQHEMVGMLLQAGADPAVADQHGNVAAAHAAHAGCMDIVELLQMDEHSVANMNFSLPPEHNVLLAKLPVVMPVARVPVPPVDDLQERKDEFFKDFIDPVSLEIITVPHVTKSGHVYDASTIKLLFANGEQSVREPVTNSTSEMLDRSELERKPCVLLRNLLEERHKEWEALLARENQARLEAGTLTTMSVSPVRNNSGRKEAVDGGLLGKKRLTFFDGRAVEPVAGEPLVVKRVRKE